MSRPTWLTIDLIALKHNFTQIKALINQRPVIAMIKANAYGHGIQLIAQALPKADAFGVTSIDEGIKLREVGITQPILLMEGLFYADEIAEAAFHNFTLVIHQFSQIEMLKDVKVAKPFPIWIKINSGMNRLGFQPGELFQLLPIVLQTSAISQESIGWMTHFADANTDLLSVKKQYQIFKQATNNLVGPKSLANSAAILACPYTYADWVRPGLILYGISPFENQDGTAYSLKPVMSLHAELIAIHQVKAGDKVGYGGEWTANKTMPIGVVSAGYGDGYPQKGFNKTHAFIKGTKCPIIGRISMDMLTVNLENLPNAAVGDAVELWGKEISLEEIAAQCQTSTYELLTRMTSRPRLQIIK